MKKIQLVVGLGIVINEQNQVLLTKRYDLGNTKVHDKWQVPGGGVEFGETPKEAVVREMKEEVCLDVTVSAYPPIIYSSVWKYPGKQVQCILIGYICTAHGQTVSIGCEETSDFSWVSYEDIDSYELLPRVREFLSDAYACISSTT